MWLSSRVMLVVSQAPVIALLIPASLALRISNTNVKKLKFQLFKVTYALARRPKTNAPNPEARNNQAAGTGTSEIPNASTDNS